jgi:hypothetical protein
MPEHTSVSQVVSCQDQNASGNNNPQPIEWAMPKSVDLHKSGLWRSSRLAALHSNETIAAHSTLPIKHTPFKLACLALFSLFCSYGMGTIALVHTHQTTAMQMPSFLTTAVNSFHQVNTPYDGTINCFSTLAQSSEASNEMFTYKQAL